jgi:hypothetical protein
MLTLLNPVKHAKTLIGLLKKSKATIFPFKENPAVTGNKEEEVKNGPVELFSMFTADIIKEEVVFTR